MQFTSIDEFKFRARYRIYNDFSHCLSGSKLKDPIYVAFTDESVGVKLVAVKVISLDKWLEDEGNRVWSSAHDSWYLNNSHNNLDVDLKIRRPRELAVVVLQAMIVAVLDFHAQGNVHGNLDKAEYYLLKRHKRAGDWFYVCRIVHSNAGKDKNSDMLSLVKLLKEKFLKPYSVFHLPTELRLLLRELEKYDTVDWAKRKEKYSRSHISLWSPRKKMGYWIAFYEYYKQAKLNSNDYSDFRKVTKTTATLPSWVSIFKQTGSPLMEPLTSVYNSEGVTYNPIKDPDLYRFIRNFYAHVADFSNFETSERIHIRDDMPDYLRKEFLEAVMSESFANYLVPAFHRVTEKSRFFI